MEPLLPLVTKQEFKELSPHIHCCCHVLQLVSVQAANATPGIKHCLHYPDDAMEVHSLLPKTCRLNKGDSESTRSSRAQDCETV